MEKLHIYNTLTRKKEEFKPSSPHHVGLYVCGPTVYSDVHIGNVRTFLSFDMVFRYLTYLGYKVRYVRNITDVGHLLDDEDHGEDKIAKRARIENVEPMELVQKVTVDFHNVMAAFNALPPSVEPTATGHIVEQIQMVQGIINNGYAYERNGSVYFDINKFVEDGNEYGSLSGRILEDLRSASQRAGSGNESANERNLDGQDDKNNPLDFAIWKKADKGHIMHWPSPWGEGFPGWHLECSVMSTKYLGDTFDIHGGGMDLKFPHHDCEIAQNIACNGHAPVRYWMHGNMLTMDGKKMSKSLGNAFSPWELVSGDHAVLERGYSPMTARFFMLQTHYSSTLDFSNEALQASEKGYKRLMEGIKTLSTLAASDSSDLDIVDFEAKCHGAMNDDFNTPILIGHLFEGVRLINSARDGDSKLDAPTIEKLKELYQSFVFEVMGLVAEDGGQQSHLLDGLMQTILDLRASARENKDWGTSDKIRDDLTALKVQVKDGKDGTSWTFNG
jgi:cysteinyl-tRNA synthetase